MSEFRVESVESVLLRDSEQFSSSSIRKTRLIAAQQCMFAFPEQLVIYFEFFLSIPSFHTCVMSSAPIKAVTAPCSSHKSELEVVKIRCGTVRFVFTAP